MRRWEVLQHLVSLHTGLSLGIGAPPLVGRRLTRNALHAMMTYAVPCAAAGRRGRRRRQQTAGRPGAGGRQEPGVQAAIGQCRASAALQGVGPTKRLRTSCAESDIGQAGATSIPRIYVLRVSANAAQFLGRTVTKMCQNKRAGHSGMPVPRLSIDRYEVLNATSVMTTRSISGILSVSARDRQVWII